MTLYNSVSLTGVKEQPFSLAMKLDSWGDKLMNQSRANFGGKLYTIDLVHSSIKETPSMKSGSSSTIGKIKAKIGYFLKLVASLFSKVVKMKYSFTNNPTDMKRSELFDSLKKILLVDDRSKGNDPEGCSDECCRACCGCCDGFIKTVAH